MNSTTNIPITILSEQQLLQIIDTYDNMNDENITNSLNAIFKHAIEMRYYLVFTKLLSDSRIDPSMYDNYAIIFASKNNYTYALINLLKHPKVNPADQNNKAIRKACMNGKTEAVISLLQDNRIDPSAKHNYCIGIASLKGYTDIAKLLLKDPRVNPCEYDNYPIKWASIKGHVEIVEVLLQDSRVDCNADNNFAIIEAMRNGHLEVVKLLLPRTDMNKINDVELLIFAENNGFIKEKDITSDKMKRALYLITKNILGIDNFYVDGEILTSESGVITTLTPEEKLYTSDKIVGASAKKCPYGEKIMASKLEETVIPKSKKILTLESLINNCKYDNNFFHRMIIDVVQRKDHSIDTVVSIQFLYDNNKIVFLDNDHGSECWLGCILDWCVEGSHIQIIRSMFDTQKYNKNASYVNYQSLIRNLKEAIRNSNEELAEILVSNAGCLEGENLIEMAYKYELPNIVKLLATKLDMSNVYDIRIHLMANA